MDTFGRTRAQRFATRPGPVRAGRLITLAALTLLPAVGCRQAMYDQPRYEPLEASAEFPDRTSARPLVEGTVARGQLREDTHLYQGMVNGALAETFPFPITREDLLRGQERYLIYCAPCHGAAGDGHGMIVERGFPQPPPFYGKLPPVGEGLTPSVYTDLREAPVGHFYDVITNGHGVMYSYKSRVAPEDRWRITAYVRALQLSQHATAEDLAAIPQATDRERDLLREVGQ